MVDWESQVLDQIDVDEVLGLAAETIGFVSVNPPGDEGPLANRLAEWLSLEGMPTQVVTHGPGRASAVGRLPGSGQAPGLILTGHLDVVGAGERPWRYEPFQGTVADGRLYGRGSADMKGALAAMMVAAASIRRAGAPLRGDLVLAFTAGEETDSLGAEALATGGYLRGADAVVVGEPSDLDVYVAEKGNLWLHIRTLGRTAHASMPHLGQNAIYAMAEVIAALENYEFPERPHPLLGRPTLSIGLIEGGVRPNVVPDACAIQVDVRTLPGQRHDGVAAALEDLLRPVRQRRPEIEVVVRIAHGREAVETGADQSITRDLVDVVGQVTGRRPTPGGVMYATDASVLVPNLGIAMTICGPGPREMAHQTDEYVTIDALVDAARIYALVALRRLGG